MSIHWLRLALNGCKWTDLVTTGWNCLKLVGIDRNLLLKMVDGRRSKYLTAKQITVENKENSHKTMNICNQFLVARNHLNQSIRICIKVKDKSQYQSHMKHQINTTIDVNHSYIRVGIHFQSIKTTKLQYQWNGATSRQF